MNIVDQSRWSERKKTISIGAARTMNYIDSGGLGTPLLLLHGYSDSSRSFSLLEPWLSSHRLIIPDLPGHAGSKAGSELSLVSFAEDVFCLAQHLRLNRVAVVGHSMGSMIGIEFAARYSPFVSALISISGTLHPAFPPDGPVSLGIHTLAEPIDPTGPFFDIWHASPHPVDGVFLGHVRREAAAIPIKVWRDILDEFNRSDLSASAKRVNVPVLCIFGSKDILFDEKHNTVLLNAFSKSQSHVMDGFGHNPHWEDPLATAAAICEFLDKIGYPLS